MTKCIVWQMPDGSLQYTGPAGAPADGQTEADYLAVVAMRAQPTGAIQVAIVGSSTIPIGDKAQHRWNGTAVVVDASVLGTPDIPGFEGALKTIFADSASINALMKKYPLFLWSLRNRNWAYVEQLLVGAKAAADLTQPQYDAIKTAAAEKSIPVMLP